LISKIFGFNSLVASNDNQANAPNVNNNNTGVNSENNVNSSDNNKTQNSVNNNGSVTNNIDLIANTGGNKISGERGDSTIQTGNINVITNIINFINANFSGKRLVMLFVNVFGNWNGNIDFLKKDAPKPVIALTDETTETQIPLAEVKVDQVKSAKVLNVNTLSDKTVPVENEKNNNEQHEKPQVLAASTNGQEDTQDGVLYESVQDKSPIDYIFSNLNWIIFGCLFTYLASVAIYLKAVKKIKI
jgi:hypothetical protein